MSEWFVRPIEETEGQTPDWPFVRLPNVPGKELPQCGRSIHDMSDTINIPWRFSTGEKRFTSLYEVDPNYCSRRAKYKTPEGCLCAGHAGQLALAILSGEAFTDE